MMICFVIDQCHFPLGTQWKNNAVLVLNVPHCPVICLSSVPALLLDNLSCEISAPLYTELKIAKMSLT